MAAIVQAERIVPGSPGAEYLRDLFFSLIQKEWKIRYKSSWLGYAWSLANPIVFACVYYVAFGVVMGVQIPHYALFLIAGLFPWQWLAHSLSAAPHIFLVNASLLKRVRFPRNFLVGATVFNDGLHFVFSIPVIAGLMLVDGLQPRWSWLLGILLLVPAQFLMVHGLALAVASLNLFFRDLDHLTGLVVNFLFFLTPIAYSSSMIPPAYQPIMSLNPVSPLMLSWQGLFLTGTLDWPSIGASYAWAFVSLGFGVLLFNRLSPRFAEVL